MGWADNWIQLLSEGYTVQFRPRGFSMTGKVDNGMLVTVSPILDQELSVGDVVLCVVKGNQYLHLIKAIRGKEYQIGNNRGGINGWINKKKIYGVLTKVE